MRGHAQFTRPLGISNELADRRDDPSAWPQPRDAFARAFATRTRDEGTAVFEGTDACVAPVLPLTEAADHPHLAARDTFIEVGGVTQPAPAPRFSRTIPQHPTPPPPAGADTLDVLRDWVIRDGPVAPHAGDG